MNINGINISPEGLMEHVDNMIYQTNILIYQAIMDEHLLNGNVDMINGGPENIRKELDDLIEYIQELEEYERCAEIKKVKASYVGLS